jgi:hypothetical protein
MYLLRTSARAKLALVKEGCAEGMSADGTLSFMRSSGNRRAPRAAGELYGDYSVLGQRRDARARPGDGGARKYRTEELYDRAKERLTLDEIERIRL